MLFLQIKYDLKNDRFETNTNVTSEKLEEFVSEFLRSQMGLGKDTREMKTQEIYEIEIKLDLSDDTFYVSSNVNNGSLVTGIMAHYLSAI
jgi:hypothetical protein